MARKPPMKTVREFLKDVSAATKPSTRALYAPYWKKLVEGFPELDADGNAVPDAPPLFAFGDRRLDDVTALEIQAARNLVMERAVRRSTSHTGQSAGEHFVGAARCLFKAAVKANYISESPAKNVDKPQRPPSARAAIPSASVLDIWNAAGSSGNDPRLDLLLLRFHLETGARRGGALALARGDLDHVRQTVRLTEKNGVRREQPITKRLLAALVAHMADRGVPADPRAVVFRYRDGRPLTRRRYDTLFARLRQEVPSAGQISAHWLRHTAVTLVEAASSYSVARTFAGHAGQKDVTSTYISITVADVAAAVGRVWGEAHPLAPSPTPPAPQPSAATSADPF